MHDKLLINKARFSVLPIVCITETRPLINVDRENANERKS